mgnify:CR=1 FL=1
MGTGMEFMLIFNIFIAAYLLYYAIKGDGKVYENDYPKAMQEEHRRMLRMFCWIAGAGMLVLSILEFMNGFGSVFTIVSIAFVLGCIVVYFVFFRIKFKEFLKKDKPAKKSK